MVKKALYREKGGLVVNSISALERAGWLDKGSR